MLQFTRRTILKLSLVAGLVLARAKLTFAAPGMSLLTDEIPLRENRTLDALLVTIIPADETPSALDAGVKERIINKSEADPKYKKMIETGCQWLDVKALEKGVNVFSELSENEREALLAQVVSGSKKAPVFKFFARVRYDAFYYYYAEPATWKALNYPGPPQPHGFRDYVLPPKRKHS